jgi:predicted nucleotidyltransferase
MKYVLVTVSRGIIEQVIFFDDPGAAILALLEYVKTMNVEHNDAALYDFKGLIANAKHFLDESDKYMENESLIEDVSKDSNKPLYIIGNPEHRLGFMVASPDDPLGYQNPVEALSDLGQMRQDHGKHLKLYRIVPVDGPVAKTTDLEKHNADCEVDDFDYSLVEEYLI